MPGVSTRMTCALPMSASPRTGPRVVCAFWVTIDTLAPTSVLVSVDLPLLGAPIRATKPQRLASSCPASCSVSDSVIGLRAPDALTHQHGERRRLLGLPLVCSLAAFRGHALDLHLGDKARCMVGARARDLQIARQRPSLALCPFLQHRFGIGGGKIQFVEMLLPGAVHHGARGLVPGVG